MSKIILRIPVITFLLLISMIGYSQNANALDCIHLRSGKKVVGIITEYKAGEYVVVRKASNNRSSRYPLEAVASITQMEDEITTGVAMPYLIQPAVRSTIELKNGRRYQGEILEYESSEDLELGMEDGTILTFSAAEIDRILYEHPEDYEEAFANEAAVENAIKVPLAARPKPLYEFRERGVFNTTSFSFSFGSRERNDNIIDPFFPRSSNTNRSTIGFNVQHIMGYQFKRMLGLGIGASYDAYDLEDGESIMSLFAHYRGYLMKKNISPYLGLSGGYGFALRNENQGVKEAKGGWMLHPEIGLRLGATSKANFTFSLGYRMQAAHYVQEFQFNGNIEYRDLVYRRMLFSLGLVF